LIIIDLFEWMDRTVAPEATSLSRTYQSLFFQ